jgi:hypothetical protein
VTSAQLARRPLGQTGVGVTNSRGPCGTRQLFAVVDDETAAATIDAAWDGIRTRDAAPPCMYGALNSARMAYGRASTRPLSGSVSTALTSQSSTIRITMASKRSGRRRSHNAARHPCGAVAYWIGCDRADRAVTDVLQRAATSHDAYGGGHPRSATSTRAPLRGSSRISHTSHSRLGRCGTKVALPPQARPDAIDAHICHVVESDNYGRLLASVATTQPTWRGRHAWPVCS